MVNRIIFVLATECSLFTYAVTSVISNIRTIMRIYLLQYFYYSTLVYDINQKQNSSSKILITSTEEIKGLHPFSMFVVSISIIAHIVPYFAFTIPTSQSIFSLYLDTEGTRLYYYSI
jgi:hypothetical protein